MASELSLRAPRPVHTGRGIALILLASVCFGSSGVIGKPAMQAGLQPEQVASARIGLSALILVVGCAVFRPSMLRVGRGDWRLLVPYGLLGVAGVQLLYFVSAARVPVGVAILLEFTSPVLIALWVRFVRGTRLPRPMWAGIALAMAGLSLVSQVWAGLRLDAVGLAAGLLAAVCSAAYFLLGEHGVSSRHPVTMVTWGMVVGGLAIGVAAPPWSLPAEVLAKPVAWGPWYPPVWVLLLTVAVVSTVLAYLAGITALRHLPASTASVLALAEPLARARRAARGDGTGLGGAGRGACRTAVGGRRGAAGGCDPRAADVAGQGAAGDACRADAARPALVGAPLAS